MNPTPAIDPQNLPVWQAPSLDASISDCWLGELAAGSDSSEEDPLARLQEHGILAAVDHLLRSGIAPPGGRPDDRAVRQAIHRLAAGLLAQDLAWRAETRRVFTAFEQQEIPALLLKGAALGQYLYPKPYLRLAGDVDILIRESDKERAHKLLYDLGGKSWLSTESSLLTREITIDLPITGQFSMPVDLHWRLSNRPLLADVLNWQELWQHSRPLENLNARALHPAHALLHAGMHRIGHHGNTQERLIWLADIHLLWLGFSRQGQQTVAQMAADKGIAGITLDALQVSASRYNTSLPESIRRALASAASTETSAEFLGGAAGPWFDLRHTRGFTPRIRFAWQLLFPSPRYMKARYRLKSNVQLPWAYLSRTTSGIIKQLRATIQQQ